MFQAPPAKSFNPRYLLAKRGAASIPRPYKVFVNSEEIEDNESLLISFPAGNNTTNLFLEVRPDRGFRPASLMAYEENWSRDENQDTETGPGDGEWAQIGPGRSTDPSSGAFRWAVSLGRLRNLMSAGKVRLNEPRITESLFNGTALSFTARSTNTSELHVLTNASGSLRQIRAPQALADIQSTTSPTQECVLKFYILANVSSTTNGGGFYSILNDTPFVTWRIRNPNSFGTYNRFQIIEERPASRTYTSEISYDSATRLWTLTDYGTGNQQRTEKRTVDIDGSLRQETVEIRSTTSTLYKAIEKYRQYPWGWELTNVVSNPDNPGNALTNSFVYYEAPEQETVYGKLNQRWFPGGGWELFFYPDGYECDDWPFGNYSEYHGVLAIPTEIRVRPWEGGPIDPTAATLQTVVVHESTRWPAAVWGHYSHEAYDLVFDSGGVAAILSSEAAADGDYYQAEERSHYYAREMRLRGVPGPLRRTKISEDGRCRMTGSWLNDLLFYHSSASAEKDVFEYALGFFDWNAQQFTVNDNSGTDFLKIKTSGLEAFSTPAWGGPYTNSTYIVEQLWTETAIVEHLACILGKSVQELTVAQAGNPVYTRLLGMSGIQLPDPPQGTTPPEVPVFTPIENRVRKFDSLGHLTNEVWIDASNTNIYRVVYEASWRDAAGNDTELKAFEINELGERFNYAYDSVKRLINITRAGVPAQGLYPAQPNLSTNRVFNAASWLVQEQVTDGTLSLTRSLAYDLAGRLTSQTQFDGITTAYGYSSDTRTVTENLPGGLTRITTRHFDGRLKSITGTAVLPEFHDYSVDFTAYPENPGTSVERIYAGSDGSPRWTEKAITEFGEVGAERRPAFVLSGSEPPIEITRSFVPEDCRFIETLNIPALVSNGEIDYLYEQKSSWLYGYANAATYRWGFGTSQVRSLNSDTLLEYDGVHWFQTTYEWLETWASLYRTNVARARLNGFTSATTLMDATLTDPDGNVTTVIATLNRAAKQVTTVTNTPASTININAVNINGLLESLNSESISAPSYYSMMVCGGPPTSETRSATPLARPTTAPAGLKPRPMRPKE